ncbi:polar amino acid transport system substrate-binding protein [Stigmatella aurantiaca]|uniref:Polar amino acid transport system substrate-binding protein n=1 Tax=Stigmatella aurantiaca TaxID=41 RepID=A0A1H7ZBC5_STIAU|nr:transporter substrate-binding domain-containing protein [Stigmatella aurantiaca]SEM55575.1 polar amino acid transport system substrate-binding protein [Stigmatella aurantiaca]
MPGVGRRAVGVLAVLVLGIGCGLPRDPNGTLERVRGGTLRAGVVERPPFTQAGPGTPSGVEATLVEELARSLGATVEWTVGTEPRLMEALKHRKLDLVVGGLSADTPYAAHVALSRPYLRARLTVGAPPGETVPRELKGHPVAVEPGHSAIALLEEEGAVPKPTPQVHAAPGLRAGFDWQLEAWGYTAGETTLKTEEVLVVAAPGENGWLRQVDLFLHENAARTRDRLVQSAREGAR